MATAHILSLDAKDPAEGILFSAQQTAIENDYNMRTR